MHSCCYQLLCAGRTTFRNGECEQRINALFQVNGWRRPAENLAPCRPLAFIPPLVPLRLLAAAVSRVACWCGLLPIQLMATRACCAGSVALPIGAACRRRVIAASGAPAPTASCSEDNGPSASSAQQPSLLQVKFRAHAPAIAQTACCAVAMHLPEQAMQCCRCFHAGDAPAVQPCLPPDVRCCIPHRLRGRFSHCKQHC